MLVLHPRTYSPSNLNKQNGYQNCHPSQKNHHLTQILLVGETADYHPDQSIPSIFSNAQYALVCRKDNVASYNMLYRYDDFRKIHFCIFYKLESRNYAHKYRHRRIFYRTVVLAHAHKYSYLHMVCSNFSEYHAGKFHHRGNPCS